MVDGLQPVLPERVSGQLRRAPGPHLFAYIKGFDEHERAQQRQQLQGQAVRRAPKQKYGVGQRVAGSADLQPG